MIWGIFAALPALVAGGGMREINSAIAYSLWAVVVFGGLGLSLFWASRTEMWVEALIALNVAVAIAAFAIAFVTVHL
jgi:hypothetical protein